MGGGGGGGGGGDGVDPKKKDLQKSSREQRSHHAMRAHNGRQTSTHEKLFCKSFFGFPNKKKITH